MVDRLTQDQRRKAMARNRGKETEPEILLRKKLWSAGLHYRLTHSLFGHPDITFPGAKLAIFIDGCFWHGCPEHYISPQTRSEFWKIKIEKNRARDTIVNERLRADGWIVLRFWEHDVRKNLDSCISQIALALGRPLREPHKP